MTAANAEVLAALRENTAEMRRLRVAIERNAQKLVSARDAAALMGVSPAHFHATNPLTPVYVGGKKVYRVSEIESLGTN